MARKKKEYKKTLFLIIYTSAILALGGIFNYFSPPTIYYTRSPKPSVQYNHDTGCYEWILTHDDIWGSDLTADEKLELMQVPAEILVHIPTDQLIDIVLCHPYIAISFLPEPDDWGNVIETVAIFYQYNGLIELLARPDFKECLIQKYEDEPVLDTDESENRFLRMEAMFAYFVDKDLLTKEEAIYICEMAYDKYEQKKGKESFVFYSGALFSMLSWRIKAHMFD
ncbi:hypothetical protein [Anaerolentibacter hominis]|uniref:hypothetical protein n=1 Tax=Anaerolentibacter hominis TaxID=3079009 RepID=UPI0031B82F73